MKLRFLKKAAAFVTAAAMAVGTLAVLPEGALPKFGIVASAETTEIINVSTPEGLNAIRNNLSGNYRLTQDIDMSSWTNWEPIGEDSPFKGTLDGDGYVIKNLTINANQVLNCGLFGVVNGGKIEKLGLENVNITSSYTSADTAWPNTAGITGGLENSGIIEQCYVTGKITANNTNKSGCRVAGLVGYTGPGASVTNCYVNAELSGTAEGGNTMVAGAVAWLNSGSSVNNSYAAGTISGKNTGYCYAGGLAASGDNGSINKSMALQESINATGSNIISNVICEFATCNDCSYLNGIAGNASTERWYNNNFHFVYGEYGVIASQEDAYLQKSYANWDFNFIWKARENDYPSLRCYIKNVIEEKASGQCGDNAYWSLTSDGILTISGSGSLYGFSSYCNAGGDDYTTAPWWKYRKYIKKIVVKSGITKITDYAFMDMHYVEEIYFEDGIKTINGYNFCCNNALTKITIPKSATGIGKLCCWKGSTNSELTIYGYSGSVAETYAKNNNLKFVDLTAVENPIEIDVQLLDKDDKKVDAITYQNGELNIKCAEVTIKNNTEYEFVNSDEEYSFVQLNLSEFSLYNNGVLRFDIGIGERKTLSLDITAASCSYKRELNPGNLSACFYGGLSTTDGDVPLVEKEFEKKYNFYGDVINASNGAYNTDEVNKKILTDNLFIDNSAFKNIYKNNKNSMKSGTCFGFSSVLSELRPTGLKTFFETNNISDIKQNTKFGNVNFIDLIRIMQFSQYTSITAKQSERTKTILAADEEENGNSFSEKRRRLEYIVSQLQTSLSTQQPIDCLLGLRWNDGGHAVTPYKIDSIGNNIYKLYVYDSNMPYDTTYIDVDLNKSHWEYTFSDKTRNNANCSLELHKGNFGDWMTIIQSGGKNKIKINEDNDGNQYSSLIISDDDNKIINSGNEDIILLPIMPMYANSNTNGVSNAYYLCPDEYNISLNNDNDYSLTYCLSDTAISADLPANAEITLNVSDDTPDDTYATVSGSIGDSISLSLEHDTLINRDFTDIKFDGVMYDTLKIQETDDGMTVSGLKSGSFEITASDGTVTTKSVDNVPESATITAIVYSDNTGDVLIDDSSNSTLSKISVDGEELSDFASDTTEYTVTLRYGTTAIPTVTATPANANADVDITQATSLTGTEAERTATITVTAEDGVTKTIYKVVFSIESHTHNLATEYSSDETGHWYACSGCDEKVDFEAHTEDSGTVTTAPTETTEGVKTFKCTKCEYVIRTEPVAVLDHTHTLATEYSSDATGHWYACSGCDEKVGFEAHIEDGGTVTTAPTETTEGIKTFKCTKCGWIIRTEVIPPISPEHTHSYGAEWKSDSTSHWHECSCGEKAEMTAHISDNGVVTVQPTETTEGVMTYSCSVCGYIMKAETIPAIEPEHTHNYGTEWKSDSISHWHECSCGDKTDIAQHISNGGTVTVQPTAYSTGLRTYSCTVCGYVIRTESIPATGMPNYPAYPSYPTYPTYPAYTPSSSSANTASPKLTVKAETMGKTAILSWNEIPNADNYIVYQLKNGKYVKVKTTTDTSVTFKNLTNGKTYKFMVRYTMNGRICSTGIEGRVTVKVYYKPITKTAARRNRIKLSWAEVPNAEKYVIYKYVDGKAVKLTETTKLSVIIKGLKPDTEYKYIVRAYVDSKWTDMKISDIVTVKTKA